MRNSWLLTAAWDPMPRFGGMRREFPGLVLFLLLSFAARRVQAQVLYGSLVGTVQDSTGAVVPGATATIVNTGTGQSHTTTTNSAGVYSLQNLLEGPYNT